MKKKNCISKIDKVKKHNAVPEYKSITNYIFNSNTKNSFYKEFIKYLKKNNLKNKESEIIYHQKVTNQILIISHFLKIFTYSFLSIIKSIILKTFLISLVSEKYLYSKKELDKKFNNLDKKEIEYVLKKLKKVDKAKFNYKVKKISDSLFLLSKNNIK